MARTGRKEYEVVRARRGSVAGAGARAARPHQEVRKESSLKTSGRSFVYVLGCSDRNGTRTYVGWTNNITKRLAAHNAGSGARSTRGRLWSLLYVEYFDTRVEAMRREYYLKRARKLRKQLSAGLLLFSAAS